MKNINIDWVGVIQFLLIGAAVGLAAAGIDGWGWFLFIYILTGFSDNKN